MPHPPSPDRLTVLTSADSPGYLDVRAGDAQGPQMATAFRTGGPGAAVIATGEMVISAPHPAPAGSRRHIIGPDGAIHGYVEYRWRISPLRCVTALVDDQGVCAWTRERSALAAGLRRLSPWAPIPRTAVMMGQEEAGEVRAVPGGHCLTWNDGRRLSRTQAALLVVALALPR